MPLFNQFHDTLAGTSIEPAYEDARDQIGHASSLAASAFNAATQSIARQIAIEQEVEMRPVVVFNPHAWELGGWTSRSSTRGLREQGHHVVDDEGESVPMQLTRPLTTMSGCGSRLRLPGRRAAARLPHLSGSGSERSSGEAIARFRHPPRKRASAAWSSTGRAAGSRALVHKASEIDLAELGREACGRDRRPQRHVGSRRRAPTIRSSASSSAWWVRLLEIGAGARRSSGSRAATALDAARGLHPLCRRGPTSTCVSRSTGANR